MSSFEGENMQTEYNVLSYRIDLHFHDYKLVIEICENGRDMVKHELRVTS